jgi:hypothetical protein
MILTDPFLLTMYISFRQMGEKPYFPISVRDTSTTTPIRKSNRTQLSIIGPPKRIMKPNQSSPPRTGSAKTAQCLSPSSIK